MLNPNLYGLQVIGSEIMEAIAKLREDHCPNHWTVEDPCWCDLIAKYAAAEAANGVLKDET